MTDTSLAGRKLEEARATLRVCEDRVRQCEREVIEQQKFHGIRFSASTEGFLHVLLPEGEQVMFWGPSAWINEDLREALCEAAYQWAVKQDFL